MEQSSIDVELDQYAWAPDEAQFLWQHENNMGNWGDYYTVVAGETTTIDDLIIMISLDGDVFEANSKFLYSKTYSNNYESLMESHRQEALESAFPEKYKTEEAEIIATVIPAEEPETITTVISAEEPEVIATVIPVEEPDGTKFTGVIFVILAIIVIIIFFSVLIKVGGKNRNKPKL